MMKTHLCFGMYFSVLIGGNMIALQIVDQKDFAAKLFRQETFDGFDLEDAEFLTRYTITLDGFLTEPEEGRRYISWSAVRPLAFQILKGRDLPHSFRITLRLNRENTEKTLALVAAIESDAVADYINEFYKGSVIPSFIDPD